MVSVNGPAEEDGTLAIQIGAQLSALERRVTEANTPGNLDGLLAYHVLNGAIPGFAWNVDPAAGSWMRENEGRLDPPALAVLGYGITHFPALASPAVVRSLREGLHRLGQRNPFPGDRLSFLYEPRLLLGICLAVMTAKGDVPEFEGWLQDALTSPQYQPADRFQGLIQQHALALLADRPARITDVATMNEPVELATARWMITTSTGTLIDPDTDARVLQRRIIWALLHSDTERLAVPRAALLYRAASDVLYSSIDQLILSRSHLSRVLRRFEAAMLRWRWDRDQLRHPIRWEISSEREVQDILWIILRSVFDDVKDEETLPKVGHSSYRADFGLPQLGILIEAKYAYKGADFKEIERQVMVDAVGYLNKTDLYKEIVVFIYDHSSSVERHELTRQALMGVSGITDVVIVSRPGMLPAEIPRSARTPRKRASASPS
ncbi:hypothetical protein AB0E08_39860 [Streptomyces sp. NPDC048281]|uniref:PD-(D/E)XK nuclease domain-containing protein n=1 Tax=Streptomyces sp. NPDC048281 TaxID=3154715 RepID=UPI003415802D